MTGLVPSAGAGRPSPGIVALRSPVALVLAGAGGGAALLLGLPAIAAVGTGAVAYVAGAALALARRRSARPRRERIDPFTVGEPWRHHVRGALQAQARYSRAVGNVAAGPLRERLEDIGRRIDQGAAECWRVAQRGDALDDAVGALGVSGTRRRLADLEGASGASASDEPVVRSLQAQLAAAERMEGVAAEARERLKVLSARLDQAVATAVELTVRAGGAADTSSLGSDVDSLVDELEALRSALDEADSLGE